MICDGSLTWPASIHAESPLATRVSKTPLPERARRNAASPSRARGSVSSVATTLSPVTPRYCMPPLRVDERGQAAALSGEEVAAGAVAAVRHGLQLLAQSAESLGQRLALAVAVAGVAGGDHRLAHLLQQLAGVGERAFGERHRVAACLEGALAGVAARHGGHRALGTRRGARVVAGALDALAAGEPLLGLAQLGLAALQGVDGGVEGVGGG